MKNTAFRVSPLVFATAFAAMGEAASAAQSQGPAADSDGLEEVMVTAERRENTTQKTAATMNVVGGDDLPAAGPSPRRDPTGLEMPAAPKLNGTIAYQHVWTLGSGALTARADVFYSSSYWAEFTHARLPTPAPRNRISPHIRYPA